MKAVFTAILLASILFANAQVPNKFNYQAIARNAQGKGIANTAISVRINILDGSASAGSVYGETRNIITNQLGLFSIAIGDTGAVSTTGNFATVNWATGKKYIKVEIDPLGGNSFVLLGSTELLSVPFALYAVNGTPGSQGPAGTPGTPGTNGSTGPTGPQGPAGAAGTVPQLGFSARLSADRPVSGIFGTPTVLAPYTELYDDGNDFNATTGVYTAPSAGVYHFEYYPAINTNSGTYTNAPCFARAYRNGTNIVAQITSKLTIADNYGESLLFAFTVKLAAGDAISMQLNLIQPTGTFNANGGNSVAASTFSGYKVY